MKRVIKRIKGIKEARSSSKSLTTTEDAVRITNDTVAEHREEVLGKARKFRYPLAQSRHRIVVVSIWLAALSSVTIFGYSLVLVYKQQSTSKYAYQFVNVLPLPVARVDSNFVSYESYLFELRHTLHYKQTQEGLDFNSDEGKGQLQDIKRLTLEKVIDNELISKFTKQAGIYVSSKEIDQQIALLESQQQLGANRSVLNNVLKKYYDWDYNDFRRSIHDQLLREKYLAYLEKDKLSNAKTVAASAKEGKDFGELAKQFSNDETTKQSGGTLAPLTKDRRDVPLQLIDAAFKLKAGEISDPIETPYGIEVIKVNENNGTEVKLQHIFIKYRNLEDILKEKRDKVKIHRYIKI